MEKHQICTITINLKYLLQLGIMNITCLLVLMKFLTFNITLNLWSKNQTFTKNPTIQICPNEIKNRTVSKVKTSYKLELLSPETGKLLGSTKKHADKNKEGEHVPKLELVEVASVHCNLVNNSYQQASKVLFTFVPNKKFGQLINTLPLINNAKNY